LLFRHAVAFEIYFRFHRVLPDNSSVLRHKPHHS
jgi:hypothetical protein